MRFAHLLLLGLFFTIGCKSKAPGAERFKGSMECETFANVPDLHEQINSWQVFESDGQVHVVALGWKEISHLSFNGKAWSKVDTFSHGSETGRVVEAIGAKGGVDVFFYNESGTFHVRRTSLGWGNPLKLHDKQMDVEATFHDGKLYAISRDPIFESEGKTPFGAYAIRAFDGDKWSPPVFLGVRSSQVPPNSMHLLSHSGQLHALYFSVYEKTSMHPGEYESHNDAVIYQNLSAEGWSKPEEIAGPYARPGKLHVLDGRVHVSFGDFKNTLNIARQEPDGTFKTLEDSPFEKMEAPSLRSFTSDGRLLYKQNRTAMQATVIGSSIEKKEILKQGTNQTNYWLVEAIAEQGHADFAIAPSGNLGQLATYCPGPTEG